MLDHERVIVDDEIALMHVSKCLQKFMTTTMIAEENDRVADTFCRSFADITALKDLSLIHI